MKTLEQSPTVLITGCSSGFGKQAVPLFLKNGWRVIATLRKAEERAHLFSEELTNYPQHLKVLSLDVTSIPETDKIIHFVQNELRNELHCLINNAGYGLFGALEDSNEAQIRAQMEVNFFGVVRLTQGILPALRKTQGRIINVSSVLGIIGMPLTSAYCASKFALEGLSESLFHELRPLGVQVSIVEPGGHRTQFGESIHWGDRSFSENSVYLEPTRRYEHFRNRLSRRPNPPNATSVAKTLLKLAEMKTMPLRVRCGSDARSVYWIKRILAESIVTGLMYRSFRKMFYVHRAIP